MNAPNNSEPDMVDWLTDVNARLRYARSLRLGYTGLHYADDRFDERFLADGGKPENIVGYGDETHCLSPGNLDDGWNDEIE